MPDTITLDEANRAVEAHVAAIVAALSPAAGVAEEDPLALVQRDVPCDPEGLAGSDVDLRFAQRSYPLTGLAADLPPAFAAFREWAAAAGFTVDDRNEHLAADPHLRATASDGYGATLEYKYGSFVLSVSSPCVPRHG